MQTVGIFGGLGPLAGAHFYQRVVEMSPATNDQEHIPVILISDPSIPNRVAHLSGTGESPVPKLTEVCRRLVEAGAQVIVLPSSTTSIYLAQLQEATGVPVISLIDAVTEAIAVAGYRQIGIMATTPTRTFGVYEDSFARAGITPIYPDAQSENDIMEVIMAVKGSPPLNARNGDILLTDFSRLGRSLREIASRSWARGIDSILLGCTELPVVFSSTERTSSFGTTVKVFSSTDILASKVVQLAYE
ncbi:aspartate/glutamate racemase family protein [Alicyclobacillus sp. SO9]|uniref:aspartate/glutamate racemase family protein n=1 Tax=Alicyclobacillus sp. SO9 TaxID=2665646 RepID=UPI0018E6DCD2|nr:amino acid racemase [Alicyclobacillus sp. SO9]QQE78242.1 amino acid racemase [Alicyclobacillus sp. SO9]